MSWTNIITCIRVCQTKATAVYISRGLKDSEAKWSDFSGT